MMKTATPFVAKYRLSRGISKLVTRYLARPFSKGGSRRVVIYHDPNRISYSQVYPFLYYAKDLFARYNVEIRCRPFEQLPNAGGDPLLAEADDVLLQPWFTISPQALTEACDLVRRTNPKAKLSFLDSYAHNDLRLARALPDDLQFYIKKSLFRETESYLTAYRGDTNLTQYYGDLYGLEQEPVDFAVPETILPKLRLCPNFFTAPHLIGGFLGDAPPSQTGRGLDMQTRLGTRGSPWYHTMRDTALNIIDGIDGISISEKGNLSLPEYMAEMQNAQLCFSPFGYGELCWRDVEAIQTGAVLIKQDMGHLHSLPDLYEAGVTYLPVKWDFSDLEEVIKTALADEALRQRITKTAYARVADYVKTRQFVDDIGFLFDPDMDRGAPCAVPSSTK